MAVIRNLVVKIAADISSLSKGLDNAQKKIQKVSASLTKAGTKLSATVTAPLVALGIVKLLTEGKFRLFTITLAVSLLSNYYIGLFTCIFVFLIFT